MIRVKLTEGVWKDLFTQGMQVGPFEVTAGIPDDAEIVDMDWDHLTNDMTLIFDVHDGDDDIHDFAICWTMGI